jgi:hypothetical protein
LWYSGANGRSDNPNRLQKNLEPTFFSQYSGCIGLDPADNIREFLTIKEGDFVSVGEQIAKREGKGNYPSQRRHPVAFLGISRID